MNALDQMPDGLDDQHRTVARILLGRPEGVTRQQAEAFSGLPDRTFRKLCREIAASEWLPTISERKRDGTRTYRIAQADESHLVNENNAEDMSRAAKLHQCARGRSKAFQAFHSAGSLFLADVPEELEHA